MPTSSLMEFWVGFILREEKLDVETANGLLGTMHPSNPAQTQTQTQTQARRAAYRADLDGFLLRWK